MILVLDYPVGKTTRTFGLQFVTRFITDFIIHSIISVPSLELEPYASLLHACHETS